MSFPVGAQVGLRDDLADLAVLLGYHHRLRLSDGFKTFDPGGRVASV